MRVVHRADRATAIHEAGHAIIALVHGLIVQEVTIQFPRNHEHKGECWIGFYEDDADSIRSYLVALLAGGAAKARFEGRNYVGALYGIGDMHGESGDRKLFDYQLHRWANLTGLSKDAATPIMHQQADQLVEEYWDLITQLADTLMQRGKVTNLRLE